MPSEGRGIFRPIQEQLYAIHRGEPAAACLHQGPCSALLGRRTRRYNPGVRTVDEYVQAVTQRPRGAHGEGGCVIHERPKERRPGIRPRDLAQAQAAGHRPVDPQVPF